MLVLLEGLVSFLFVLMSCVIGIANGPHNMVFFYDQEVQDRVAENGLITKEQIKHNYNLFKLCGILPYFIFVIIAVYVINGARGFLEPFIQMTFILMIEGILDRLFIDWYWVNHTKAWIIPGTEDLRPYINKKAWTRKLIGTVIGFPIISAMIAGALSLIWK